MSLTNILTFLSSSQLNASIYWHYLFWRPFLWRSRVILSVSEYVQGFFVYIFIVVGNPIIWRGELRSIKRLNPTYVEVSFVFHDLRWEVVIRCVDIDRNVDH